MVGWPCPVLTSPRVDYKGVQGELLCYCLQPWYLIACYGGELQSHALSYNINLDLKRNLLFAGAIAAWRWAFKWHLRENAVKRLAPFSRRSSCLMENHVFHQRLCWHAFATNTQRKKKNPKHFFCLLGSVLLASINLCNIIPLGRSGRAKPNE